MRTYFCLNMAAQCLYSLQNPQQEILATAEKVKTFAIGLIILSIASIFLLISINAAIGIIPMLGFMYLCTEVRIVADNLQEILENPYKKLYAGYAMCCSDEKLFRYVADKAPLITYFGLAYIDQLGRL